MSKNRRCKAPLEGIMNQTESLVTEIQKGNRRQRGGHPECIDGGSGKGHILLEDIPGVGKTTLALAFSKVLGMDYKRIQFTPDVIPSDVVGFTVYDKKTDSFIYKPGAVMCNLLLADEINRTSSKTQAALLEVMEEGSVTVDGKTYPVAAAICRAFYAESIWFRGHSDAAAVSAGPVYGKTEHGLSGL